jgi:hypothetical protein
LIADECFLSLAPGFSRVMATEAGLSRFNGLAFGRLRKRLKPFSHSAPFHPPPLVGGSMGMLNGLKFSASFNPQLKIA